jgi:RsbT co-antagonist protein rsbRD N-terminal domain
MENYVSDASDYLKQQENKFANPTGMTLSKEIENLFVELLRGPHKENTSKSLGNILKIMAVQNIPASQALSFIFSLKKIIREELHAEIAGQELLHEILLFESTIDNLALSAIDIFMGCREKMYEIKSNEIKRAHFRFLQRANIMSAACEQKTAPVGANHLNIKEDR